jgi:hypothetical protein
MQGAKAKTRNGFILSAELRNALSPALAFRAGQARNDYAGFGFHKFSTLKETSAKVL